MRSIEEQDGGTSVVTTTIKEEQRLAAVVGIIDSECAVVPRGAYVMPLVMYIVKILIPFRPLHPYHDSSIHE